ncbi:Tat pathway signal sequence domain protein [Brevundimonas sp. A19_0]|uniref:Tat pathway signal sequence domain protein n=1 Tax=Brevundimonas sp. A19_0 TaxID=2821087 RepID=UPI001ADA419D|nr:Tat pathway signal sequence domain protein [Brevundimonas sp. A19_0]MBO9502788.1 Tat pathway signal sequence domain protein [Brevundimonas sp. A19_0]
MRRVLALAFVAAVSLAALPDAAQAQSRPQNGQTADGNSTETRQRTRVMPLSRRANAGPCPVVRILYDAARYVELQDQRAVAANVGYTGEIEGVTSDCRYRDDDPIVVDTNMLFALGKGPSAEGDGRTYRYWVAVTSRDQAILAKEYFDLPVQFDGQDRTRVSESQTIVIPRASAQTSGANFEILIGFDVTPEMAEFNRVGSRFCVDASGTSAGTCINR